MNSLVENKISLFQSAFSLQNSTFKYSFPKSNRFIDIIPTNDVIYNLPTEPSRKAASIGYGCKTELADKSAKNIPSVNDYTITSIFDQNLKEKRGCPIAKKYKDLTISKTNVPGPGSYEVNGGTDLKHKVLVSLRSRLMFFYGILKI